MKVGGNSYVNMKALGAKFCISLLKEIFSLA